MVALTRSLSIVIPTYNEVGNVQKLIKELLEAAEASNLELEVVIVDDNSPDGTSEAVLSLVRKEVTLLCREGRKGLASAVYEGFQKAKNEVMGVMDADFNHPPMSLPQVAAPVLEGHSELSVGSRHVQGGEVSDWTLQRKLISAGAALLARGLTSIKDPMSGYFFTTKTVLARGGSLDTSSWKILLEIIVKCRPKNIVEVPITFSKRVAGESKLDSREQLNYLKHLLKLYTSKYLLN